MPRCISAVVMYSPWIRRDEVVTMALESPDEVVNHESASNRPEEEESNHLHHTISEQQDKELVPCTRLLLHILLRFRGRLNVILGHMLGPGLLSSLIHPPLGPAGRVELAGCKSKRHLKSL